ncbi:MAG TPA: tetratricopeptide repeat protein [Streptosporangiaceae bacterium]|nr:tetratricopeptide repeat protein [Streptosporangiaceae bacterium]
MTAFMGSTSFQGDSVARDKIVHMHETAVPLAPPRQLPLDIAGFTGRADILSQLGALIERSEPNLSPVIITITGMPGVGKTALAVHWAHLIADAFPDGHVFIDLRGFSDRAALSPRDALSQALRALNVPDSRIPAEEDELAALYRSQVSGKRLLVVLDDALNSRQAQPLLPGSASCVVVVTARNDLTGLIARNGARALTLDLLPDLEAIELVRAIVGAERTDAEPDASAELVRLCARLPLALRVAAANLAIRPQQTVAATVHLLSEGDRLANLTLGEDLNEAVGAAFDLSYRGLSPDLQLAFRMLGLVEGPTFTPAATGALLAVTPIAARRVLTRLEGANLVQAVSHDRYQLHELLREYARRRAEAEDERLVRDSAVQRLAEWCLTAAQRAGGYLYRYRRTIGQELAVPLPDCDVDERNRYVDWFVQEQLNLIEVVGQTSRLGWDQLTWELADAVYDFFELGRYCHENITVHQLGLAAAERRGNLPAQFFMRHHLAVTYRELGEFPMAFAEARRAVDLGRQVQDRYGTASALDNIARIHLYRSAYKEALAVAEDALEIRMEIGDQCGQGATLDTMARGHQGLSHYREAIEKGDEALRIRREIGDLRGEAETLDNIAHTYERWGIAPEALQYAERALAIRKKIGDRNGEAETLALLGRLDIRVGKYSRAHDFVDRALAIWRSIADRRGEAQALVYMSTILRRLGTYGDAVQIGLEALDIMQELGDRHGEAEALNSLARSYRRQGAYDRAGKDAVRSLRISRSIGDRHGEAEALHALALIALHVGRLDVARQDAIWSVRIRRWIGDRRGQADSLDLLGKVYYRMGMLAKADRTLSHALKLELKAGDSFGAVVTLRARGEIARDLGEPEQGLRYLQRALELAREVGNLLDEARILWICGPILETLGDTAGAAKLFTQAQRIEHELLRKI